MRWKCQRMDGILSPDPPEGGTQLCSPYETAGNEDPKSN